MVHCRAHQQSRWNLMQGLGNCPKTNKVTWGQLQLGAMATTTSGLEPWGRYWDSKSISIALSSLRRFDPILCAATPCYCTTWYGYYGQLACNVGGVVIKHASTRFSTFSRSRGGQRDLAHHACLVAPLLPTKKKTTLVTWRVGLVTAWMMVLATSRHASGGRCARCVRATLLERQWHDWPYQPLWAGFPVMYVRMGIMVSHWCIKGG